jgi:hypothetical protein
VLTALGAESALAQFFGNQPLFDAAPELGPPPANPTRLMRSRIIAIESRPTDGQN